MQRSSKREVWKQMQDHLPEYESLTREIAQAFGISRVLVKTPAGKFDTGEIK